MFKVQYSIVPTLCTAQVVCSTNRVICACKPDASGVPIV